MNRMTLAAAPLAMALLAAACTTTGVGTAESPGGAVTGTFTWKASSPDRGDMTAVLNDGQTYQGRFFQITRDTTIDTLGPLWTGWPYQGPWHGWGYWEPGPAFVTQYTGKVVANLAGPAGHLRCHFTLIRPASGMSGGGEGQCQLPGGGIIHADFPPSS